MRHKADGTKNYITGDLDFSNHSDDNGEGENEYLLAWKKKKGDTNLIFIPQMAVARECFRNNDELGLKYKEP